MHGRKRGYDIRNLICPNAVTTPGIWLVLFPSDLANLWVMSLTDTQL
jgi:hypothetical protein